MTPQQALCEPTDGGTCIPRSPARPGGLGGTPLAPPAARPMRRDRLGRRVGLVRAGLGAAPPAGAPPAPAAPGLAARDDDPRVDGLPGVGAPARRHRPPSPPRPAVGGDRAPSAARLGLRRPLRPAAMEGAA